MTLRQVGASNQDERIGNVELGLARGKEAVGLDTSDGTSWSLLGNAYLSHFFQVVCLTLERYALQLVIARFLKTRRP